MHGNEGAEAVRHGAVVPQSSFWGYIGSGEFRTALLDHRGLALLALIQLAIALMLASYLEIPFIPHLYLSNIIVVLVPLVFAVMLIYRTSVMILFHRPARPLLWLMKDLTAPIAHPTSLANGIAGLAVMLPFLNSYMFVKATIPAIVPFKWDAVFARADRVLHLGRPPFAWIYAIHWPSWAVTVVNFFYHAWFFVLFGTLFATVFSRARRELRLTFLYAFLLTWAVGGNLLALLFSSAGPVYVERLGFGNEFQPLVQLLVDAAKSSPVWALDLQDMLWQGYVASDGRWGGISAMPSMHVASAVLFALLGFGINRSLGYILAAFAVMIMLGSVALGWHYAIDGYVGALVATANWFLATRLSRSAGVFGLAKPPGDS
ncbi:MAG TPA: phosphatase PAP2 family protein [Dongiaceae bacterium]|nr:phosphatase PAP2 family protein [Dongiaceae bacterium]